MKAGTHIKLTADIEFRAKLLIDEYTQKINCEEEILNALDRLKKYIGEENKIRFNEMLLAKNYKELLFNLRKIL